MTDTPRTPPNQKTVRRAAIAERRGRGRRGLIQAAALPQPDWAAGLPGGLRPQPARVVELALEDVFGCVDEARSPVALHVLVPLHDPAEHPGWVAQDSALGTPGDFDWLC